VRLPGPAQGVRIYLKTGWTDMRKSINGLSALVDSELGHDPLSGSLFCFCNRKRDMLKLLFWERNGFCIWHKRLSKDRFPWPRTEIEALEVTSEELTSRLDGVNLFTAFQSIKYSRIA
jgi:transposase